MGAKKREDVRRADVGADTAREDGGSDNNSGRSYALHRPGNDNSDFRDHGRSTWPVTRDTSSWKSHEKFKPATEVCAGTLPTAGHRAPETASGSEYALHHTPPPCRRVLSCTPAGSWSGEGANQDGEAVRFSFLGALINDDGGCDDDALQLHCQSCTSCRYASPFTPCTPTPTADDNDVDDQGEGEFDGDASSEGVYVYSMFGDDNIDLEQPNCRYASLFTPLPRRRRFVTSAHRRKPELGDWRHHMAKSYAVLSTESAKIRFGEILNFELAERCISFTSAVSSEFCFEHRCSIPFTFASLHDCSLGPGGTMLPQAAIDMHVVDLVGRLFYAKGGRSSTAVLRRC